MTGRLWTADNVKAFHQQFGGTYQGDRVTPILLQLTRKFLKHSASIADAGAGSGALVAGLRAAYPEKDILGIDLVAQPDLGVIEGNLCHLDLPDESFDGVFCTEVLEHMTAETMLVAGAELLRILRPNGHLILTVPNHENLTDNQVFCPHCSESYNRWGHLQSLGLNDLVSLVGKSAKLVWSMETNLMLRARFPFVAAVFHGLRLNVLTSDSLFRKNLVAVFRKTP